MHTHGRIRTDTGRILSPLSLPLDYMGEMYIISMYVCRDYMMNDDVRLDEMCVSRRDV